ncbi:MAG: DUF6113 family protein [Sporichthyaceae bacterium]
MAKPAPAPARHPIPVVLAGSVVLVALGLAVGTAGAFVHPLKADLGPAWPTGLLLSVLAIVGVVISAGLLTRSRFGAAAVLVGWTVSVAVFTSPRADGDVVIAANGAGYAYLGLGLISTIVASMAPYAPRPPVLSSRTSDERA